jgi:dienelactone hydrolase
MSIQAETLHYQDGDQELEAYFAYDSDLSGPLPVVLIQHAWGGRDAFVADKALKLAELGYLGFACDTYGKGVLGASAQENSALMQPFLQDRAKLQRRVHAGLAAARQLANADGERIAVIGFCFGGLCALDLARSGADRRAGKYN